MATSGSIDFGLNAGQVITAAMTELRVVDPDETLTASQSAQGQQVLNLLLKDWQKYENLWRLTEGSLALTASTYSYTLSPVPHRVVAMRYRDASSPAHDLPMTEMTREEYFDLPLKVTTGVPTQYYIDYQRTAATLKLWQSLASVTTETIVYTYQRKFEDIDALTNDIDIRQEWLETVVMNLAYKLGPRFGRVGTPAFAEVKEMAVSLKEQMLDEDREDFIRFVPFSDGYYW